MKGSVCPRTSLLSQLSVSPFLSGVSWEGWIFYLLKAQPANLEEVTPDPFCRNQLL